MRRMIVLMMALCAFAGAAQAQGTSAATPTLKVSDGQKSFNGVNELRVPVGCVTFSGRTAVINCAGGTSSSTTSSQNANLFFASPNGSYGLPSWRAILEADLPAISQSKVTNLVSDLAGKQPLDSDLTAIAALAPTNDDVMQRKAGAWVNRTPAQLKTDLALTQSDVGLSNVDNTSDATKNAAAAALTNKTINADANTITNIENADIKAAAAIDATKIATGTVDNTEFGHLNGVTSAIQTQIAAKFGGTVTTGTIAKASGAGTLADSVITESGGRIGIGVAPSATLSLAVATSMSIGTTGQAQIVGNYAGSGEIPAGAYVGSAGSSGISLIPSSTAATAGAKVAIVYHNGAAWYSALEVGNVAGGGATRGTLSLMKSGGAIEFGGTRKQGANGTVIATERLGTCTLVAGTCTVADTNVTAASKIFLTAQDNNTTGTPRISARTAATSFTITSSNGADTGVVAWHLVN